MGDALSLVSINRALKAPYRIVKDEVLKRVLFIRENEMPSFVFLGII